MITMCQSVYKIIWIADKTAVLNNITGVVVEQNNSHTQDSIAESEAILLVLTKNIKENQS
jgi:hypothetical protein